MLAWGYHTTRRAMYSDMGYPNSCIRFRETGVHKEFVLTTQLLQHVWNHQAKWTACSSCPGKSFDISSGTWGDSGSHRPLVRDKWVYRMHQNAIWYFNIAIEHDHMVGLSIKNCDFPGSRSYFTENTSECCRELTGDGC